MEKGLTEAKIGELDGDGDGLTPRERVAVEFAELMATNHQAVDEALFARLGEHFDDPQILELGMMIGQYIGFGRLLQVLDLEPKSCPVEEP